MEQKLKTEKQILVDYGVVTEMSGHQPNVGVKLVDAAKDIFSRVKEKAMQLSVKGEFMEFETVNQLIDILKKSVVNNYRIMVFDECYGG